MTVVLNELLGRPLLKIYQDPNSFNFSLDSMLLASFATISPNTKKICDLCSGNAPIPLYLTLRTNASILGVEIQKYSYELAQKSVIINKKEAQINIICDNLCGVSNKIGKEVFDLVTCNPPFFKKGSACLNPNDEKIIARHEVMCTLDDVCKEASSLLKTNGRFAMVHRPDRLVEIIETMKKYRMEPKRLQFVYPKQNKQCNHILIEGIKDGKSGGLVVLEQLFVYNEDNKWTKEILKIYNFEEE